MDQQQFYDQLNDRMRRYGASPLDPTQVITITASPDYLASYDGQVAALVACNLIGRLSPSVQIGFPDIAIHPRLPWAGRSLVGHALDAMRAADPFGSYGARVLAGGDFRFHLGPDGHDAVVHGSGWNAYIGQRPSPLPLVTSDVGVGAAQAVVLGAGHLFRTRFGAMTGPFACNAWDWTDGPSPVNFSPVGASLGKVMTTGLGSVGSAANYFLTLATRDFRAILVDHDGVGIHNITRSPLFTDAHAKIGLAKVEAVAAFLRGAGVEDVAVDPVALHESALWKSREAGWTDVLISAANEFNVRYHIEMGFPPIQLYATTGRNWQVTLMRHLPGAKACSLCVFPPDKKFAPTTCATDASDTPQTTIEEKRADAALPFLSFAAGLMTAAEVLKLTAPGYPFSAERVMFSLKGQPLLVGTPIPHRTGCPCEGRHKGVHQAAIAGSRYAEFAG
ncbi:ThiF family adenylyltransferase [Mycobacterium sp. KBS0706]|uniref:ThiF family adenylyltransferase n=1 Tax=Mycobacterium sp. KBS0706 TaxID=2578109 RepID=UPI00163DCA05|nr:ThiF family adenylyltransferase [Mycobacterium sp. KBS0706]